MRKTLLSTVLALLAAPALAGPIDGTWAQNPADCSGDYPETQLKISGADISFIESRCTLANPTALRDMPEAQLYDVRCSGEGMTWSDRALIGTNGENGLVIYMRGYVSTYQSC